MLEALNPKDARVLLVEDGPNDQAIAIRALQSFGIRHYKAVRTAEEGLIEASRHKFDVALVDYRLPRMNGLEFIKSLQTLLPDIRVIVVSGVRQESVAVAAIKLGASDYITKDEYQTSGIIRSLQAALRERETTEENEQLSGLTRQVHSLQDARVAGRWMLQAIDARHGYRPNLVSDDTMSDQWLAVVEVFSTYLRASFAAFPSPATDTEDALLRALIERGSSSRDVVAFYLAALQDLSLEWDGLQASTPVQPMLFLSHVMAAFAEECQVLLSLQGLEQLQFKSSSAS